MSIIYFYNIINTIFRIHKIKKNFFNKIIISVHEIRANSRGHLK